jgi:hypothetical protein
MKAFILSSPSVAIGDMVSITPQTGLPITSSGMTAFILSSPSVSIGDMVSKTPQTGFPMTPS